MLLYHLSIIPHSARRYQLLTVLLRSVVSQPRNDLDELHTRLDQRHLVPIMTERSEYDKMIAGQLYNSSVPDLVSRRARAKLMAREYNTTIGYVEDMQIRQQHLEELIGTVGPGCEIEPPFRCDYGSNISLGKSFYSNFDLVILDWYVLPALSLVVFVLYAEVRPNVVLILFVILGPKR